MNKDNTILTDAELEKVAGGSGSAAKYKEGDILYERNNPKKAVFVSSVGAAAEPGYRWYHLNLLEYKVEHTHHGMTPILDPGYEENTPQASWVKVGEEDMMEMNIDYFYKKN